MDRIRLWLVVTAIAGSSLIFWRGVRDSFDLPKATLVWFVALALVPIVANHLISKRTQIRRFSHWFLLGLAFSLATVISSNRGYSVFGQEARYTGLLTLIGALLIGFACAAFRGQDCQGLLLTLSISALGVSAYALLQFMGRDPFDWVISSFGSATFGTMGNPNTAAGLVANSIPISLFILLKESSTKVTRIVCAASMGLACAAIPTFQSFQGQVVSALSLVFLVCYFLRFCDFSFGNLTSLFLLSVPLVVSTTGVGNVVLLVIAPVAAVCALAVQPVRYLERSGKNNRSLFLIAVGSFVVLLSGMVFAGGWTFLSSGIADGLLERGDFYRAAWKRFLEVPVFGSGLETFGFDFPRLRSAGHATALETSRTGSVHSIPLALLVSGGAVLGAALLFFWLRVFTRAVSIYTRDRDTRESIWLPFCWIAIWVQLSVSVEHVALFVQVFVFAGILEAYYSEGKSGASARLRVTRQRKGISVAVIGAVLLVGLLPLSSPFRANARALQAIRAYNEDGDAVKAAAEYKTIVDLAPWSLQFRSDYAALLGRSGLQAEAIEELRQVARESNYVANFAIPLAEGLAAEGQLLEARNVLLKAHLNDPYAPTLTGQVVDYLTKMGDAYLVNGDIKMAESFYLSALNISPQNLRVSEALASLRGTN